MTLTAKAADTTKPREKAYKLADAHDLCVSPKGAKSWRSQLHRGEKAEDEDIRPVPCSGPGGRAKGVYGGPPALKGARHSRQSCGAG